MKKKFSVVVCVVIALLVSLSLAACSGKKSSGDPAGGNPAGGDPAGHTHEYAATYQRDDAEHWRECKTCGEITDRAMHEFDGGNRCTVCGYEFTAGLAFRDVGTDECHLKNIGTAINEADIIIPASYDGRKVTGIDSYAFRDCANIRSVTIPSSIKTIGTGAFNGCTALGTVDWNAKNCSQVTLPIFDGCTSLNIITVKEDAEYLPKGVFSDCSALENLTVPFVGDGTPENSYLGYLFGAEDYNRNADFVPSTLSAVTVKNATAIGDGAFYNCSGLSEITLPANATSIGAAAFNNCSGLSEITLPANITEIGDSTFYGCSGLSEISIPENVTKIGDNAFSGCRGLAEITIPENITEIGDSTFYYCSSLTEISIPENVTKIGDNAFSGCSSLEKIDVVPGNTAYISRDGILYNHEQTEFVHIPRAIKGAVVIPDGITSIGDGAFYGCRGLTGITIPQSVTEIGGNAFYYCTNLQTITFDGDSKLETIGGSAFYNCSYLSEITIPASVTEIGYEAFGECNFLKSVHYDGNISGWCAIDFSPLSYGYGTPFPVADGYDLYIGGNKVTDLSVPQGVTEINAGAFYNCNSITSVTLPASVTSIGSSAFDNCRNLKRIDVNSGNTTYSSQNGILYNHDKTEFVCIPRAIEGAVTIPEGITRIDSYAFSNSGITAITIPESVNYIGEMAFSYSGLTEITIPENVTSIGRGAFYGCYQLQTATFVDPTGWKSSRYGYGSSEPISDTILQNSSTAAEYLTRYYSDYTWTKG